MAQFVMVRRRADGKKGSLMFFPRHQRGSDTTVSVTASIPTAYATSPPG
jgi:hypothetical protein